MVALRAGLVWSLLAVSAFSQDDPFPPAKPEDVGLDSALLERLAGVVQSFVDDDEIVGGELLVIQDRRTVLHRAFGKKDHETGAAWEKNTIVNIRSMSKPLTGTLAQMAIDAGRLSLSDPVSKWLPSFAKGKSAGITIEHLITHRSGLPMTCIDRELEKYTGLRAIADQAAGVGPDFEPGSRFQYSDAGSDSLGAVLEVVGEASLDEEIRSRILAPLGMTDSGYRISKDDPRHARLASIHVGMRNAWRRYWHPGEEPFYPFAMGSQSVWSTPRDYARFLALWMDGGRVGAKRLLSDEAIERGLEPVSDMRYPTQFGDLKVNYGRMWQLWLDDAKRLVAFGHSGSDGTYAIAFPERDLMAFYFTQSRGQQIFSTFERALDAAVIHPDAARLDMVTAKIPDAALRPFLGIYRREGDDRYRAVVLHQDKLAMEAPGEQILVLQATDDPDQWQLEQLAAQKLTFVRDDQGEITHLDLAGPAAEERLTRLAPEPEAPTIDELMPRVMAAHGSAAFETIGGYRFTGQLDIQAQKRQASFEDLYRGARHRLMKVEHPGLGGQRLGMDGDSVWSQPPGAGPTRVSGIEAEQMILGSWGALFGDWRQYYREVRVLYRREFAGEDCWVVRAVPPLGTATTKYVSVETGRLVGEDRIPFVSGLAYLGTTVTFEDVRDVGGLKIPFVSISKSVHPMIGTIVSKYETVELDVEIPEETFAMPQSEGD